MTAYVHLRADPHYRIDAFAAGCARLGHHVEYGQPCVPLGPDDVAIVWNKTARSRQTFEMARKGGGAVIVLENGYHGGPDAQQTYAMALDGHCGSGRWFVGGEERLDALEIDFKPWIKRGNPRVLVVNQRGIGSPRMASPHNFALDIAERLRAKEYGAIIREHPGRHAPAIPLAEHLALVGQVVVWSSNCATQALIAGIPTYYCAPHIVTEGAALRFDKEFEFRPIGERRAAFNRMAWAQAFLPEIESGEAIDRLLRVHAGELPACHEGLGL